ncbi:MAG: ASKHA domain-containing protein [Candidatus Omnitrophica bacterium]|nr:ASKHA domain-containing protein [Candidatus Omnitrophota bacterium]
MEKFRITFYPDNKTIEIEKDKTILSAAISAGVYINSVCGGDGVCGKCRVIIKKGQINSPPESILSPKEKEKNICLACMATVHSDLEVEIPAGSRLDFAKSKEQVYSETEEIEQVCPDTGEKGFAYLPLVRKVYLELPQPRLEDNLSDLERLYRYLSMNVNGIFLNENTGLGPYTSLANLKQLGELLRDAQWQVTVTLANRDGVTEIISVEAGDTSGRNYGACFDIGTTTISGQLIDLKNGMILGTKASYNKQAAFGSDIISRIIYARQKDGLSRLHKIVVDMINEIIRELTAEHNIDLNDLSVILCAGNTTMMHLLLEIDPSYIRKEPYVPTLNLAPVIRSAEIGMHIKPRGLLYCLPGVSSYVGADTTAGVLATGLYNQEELGILIDIGTNGEIALGNKEFLVSAAASAGPAFEGSGVACGMRASGGAIQRVKINPKDLKVTLETIGNTLPRGICGSGYIDALAQMLVCGIIDKSGKIKSEDKSRVRQGEFGKEFVLVFAQEAQSGDITITEADIENIKRAKAAIYSACAVLVRRMGLDWAQVKKIFIAGGFGTYLDMESAIRIGLLPDLERGKFQFVGNSALAGARQALVSYEAMQQTKEIARKMTYVELSVEPAYMDEYMAALFFPHTDLNLFPSLRP